MLLRSQLDRLITFLGITGFILAITLAPRVFPNAVLELNVPRQTIYQTAQTYLKSKNSDDFSQYQSIQSFREAWMASVYLQRTLGTADTNRLIKEKNLPIYYWGMRWFKPSQQKEFYVSVATDGDIIGYSRTLPEAEPGAELSETDAQTIAQNYLIDERGWDLTDWETLDNSTTQRPNRTDHTFQWKRKDWSLEDSEVRLSVTIQGDQIGSYGYWFKVPEAFMREYRKTRNIARFWDTNTTSVLNNGALIMAALFYLIALARGKLNWRSGLTPALIVFGVSLLSQWNTLPLAKNYYSTTENYGLFWLQEFFDTFYFAFIRAVPIYFLWAGGQQIAKRVWPQKDMILARHSNRLATFTQAYWRGIMLGGLSMIYLVGFYFIAIHGFNAWSPLDVNYSNLFSTPLPFMSSLRNGILPGIGEELEARLVWVGTLLLVVRYRWLALVIPGGLWAFAHVGNYVSEPFYLRGIELWLPAFFLYGLFFLRFGLVTVMVGHCVYNSLLGALLLIKTEDAYLVGSGILVIGLLLLPLLPGLWQWWRRPHGFKDSAWELVPAMPEDYDQILSLPLGAATLPKQLESEDGLPRDYEIICLKGPMGVVGVSIAHVDSDRATLQQVYVKPRFRRCYYGSRLVDGLVKQLRQRGVRRVNVVAKTASTTEKRFWANQNWKPVSNTWQIGG